MTGAAQEAWLLDGFAKRYGTWDIVGQHLRFYSDRRGYVRTTVGRKQIRADFRGIDAVSNRGAAARTVKSFVILDGKPGLQKP